VDVASWRKEVLFPSRTRCTISFYLPPLGLITGGFQMEGTQRERWMQLCEQAAAEKDAHRLMELVKEINRLLAEKEQRLNPARGQPRSA